MKKAIAAFIFLFTFAQLQAVFVADQTRNFSLQGAYGDVAEINIEEISAQTSSYKFGMPFDIQDVGVQANAGIGRPIAHWSVLSNTPFNLTVKMEQLTHTTLASDPLDYILSFSYDIAYRVGTEQRNNSGTAIASTLNETNVLSNIVPDDANVGDSFIGSVDGTVFFRFEEKNAKGESIQELITGNGTPAGEYAATVTFIVEPK